MTRADLTRALKNRDHAAALGVIIAIAAFGGMVNYYYDLTDWLVWKYLKCWAWSIVWVAAAICAGAPVVAWAARGATATERLMFSAAVGVYLWYVAVFLGGLLGLLHWGFALLLPALMLVAGGRHAAGMVETLWSRLRAAEPKPARPSSYLVTAFGLLCLGGIYFSLLSPTVVSFDAQMYHLGLAEEWASTGHIGRSVEGWFVETLPQLTAVINVWPLLVPGLDYFEHIELTLHLEFVILIMTLASIPLLVQWLVPASRARLSWVALFLFPSVFIYDAGLFVGSDHFAAFFAVPIALALRRAMDLDPRWSGLLALFVGCAVLTKYQAFSLAAGPIIVVLFFVARGAIRSLRSGAGLRADGGLATFVVAPMVALGVGLVATSPHWLKNWVWYGDPAYPLFHAYLDLDPWHRDASNFMNVTWSRLVIRPRGNLMEQLGETALNSFTYAYRDFARGRFHGKWPQFGSLFSLCLLWLPFVRPNRRVWLLFGLANVGVFIWYFLSYIERYLQALIPWMAAVVAAAIILGWQRGRVMRGALVVLVGLQILWGADALFYPTHAMIRDTPFRVSARLMSSGFRGKVEDRNRIFGSLQNVGDALPEGATVLLHENNPRTGLRASIISDMARHQGGINYGELESAAALWRLWKDMGVTHLLWRNNHTYGFDTVGGDLRFWDFAVNWAQNKRRIGGWVLAELPAESPPETGAATNNLVAYAGCANTFARGFHLQSSMNVDGTSRLAPQHPFPPEAELTSAIQRAGFVVYNPKCRPTLSTGALSRFTLAVTRKGEQLWIARQ